MKTKVSARSPVFLLAVCAAALLLPGSTAAQTPELAALWAALTKPAFDPNKVAIAENVQLQRDVATVVLVNGRLGLAQPPTSAGRVFAATFKGAGRLRFAPRLPLELQQLRFHSGQAPLEAEFTEAMFIFTDNTLEQLSGELSFQPGNAAELQKIYWERNEELVHYGLNWRGGEKIRRLAKCGRFLSRYLELFFWA